MKKLKTPFKKIAIVTPYYYPLYGGVQEYVYHLKKEYKKLGYYVRVITGKFKKYPSKDENEVLRIGKGFPIKINGSVGRIILVRRAEKIKQTLDTYNFDIIHLQEPFVPFLSHAVINNSKALNVATFHANFEKNDFYRFARPLLQPLWKKIDGKIAVSPSAKSSILKYFSGDIEIIPNGVDTKRFSPLNKKLKKFDDGMINILFTGRIEKRKGLIYLLHAYKILKKKYPNIRLIIVGKGPLMKDHMKYVSDNGLQDVYFEGFVSTEILPNYYSTSHIYCSPALFGESFGIVLLEAMAAGLPVVAFNISGYNDVVSNMSDGLLAEPRDVRDLAMKLEMLITDKKLRKELGNNGLKKSRRFTWESIAKRNIEFYKKLWKRKK